MFTRVEVVVETPELYLYPPKEGRPVQEEATEALPSVTEQVRNSGPGTGAKAENRRKLGIRAHAQKLS